MSFVFGRKEAVREKRFVAQQKILEVGKQRFEEKVQKVEVAKQQVIKH